MTCEQLVVVVVVLVCLNGCLVPHRQHQRQQRQDNNSNNNGNIGDHDLVPTGTPCLLLHGAVVVVVAVVVAVAVVTCWPFTMSIVHKHTETIIELNRH